MRTHGQMIGTDDEIKSRAVQTVRLIQEGLLEEEERGSSYFTLNQARVLDPEKYRYRNEQQFNNRSVLDGQIDRRAEKRCHNMI
jgi:hypothetical protein